ncbi:EamA family transporter RarD [Tabrizicola sp. TH137]|uniref:EamA family transporter RarD n=1 Tax=Tabrizicola sp. TH137 TaxID=2067452 RepID=UPI000C7E2925|nr:EamA family transporter RarD [Tabrizicola sp. TH137]PLL13082.1 EamA family transporter RarD [Tabrizicola sp. TH137]
MSDPVPAPTKNEDSPKGLFLAIAAYLMWGFLPLYMKALSAVPVLEVLAHRVVWSVPVAGAILIWLGRTADLKAALRSPRMIGMAALTAGLISVNWAIYVWSIQSGQALEAALGYYINPLFSIFLGAVLLGERMNRAQGAAIALAAAAVAVLTWEAGRVPLVALGLTVSWGFYAYLKKRLPLGPNQGFMLEVLILSPLALGFLLWQGAQGGLVFGADAGLTGLLLLAGVVTAVPLMVYANGAKLLRLSTIGILQYIAPTMIFLTAVFVFGEEFGTARAVAFPMIWAALVIYTGSMLKR